ncbi:transketolase [Malassezia sp. CBS 17886]|nr:transketolase [Malassezia sp. CBS 17886]
MSFVPAEIDVKAVTTIRALAADANSGHPGAPMGLAPVAQILYSRFLNCDPKASDWINRDHLVLSNGHACALLYIILHLMGYKLSMEDLKHFRKVDSLTPGHPEANHTDGVEVTTGPLGQGFGNAVGLAMARKNAAATFNKDGFELFNSRVFVIVGDGCLEEGIASEAASLAGHLRLDNLITIYDDNRVSIDGDTNCAFTENVGMRFESYGWNVLHVTNGDTDLKGLYEAIEKARQESDRPTIIRVNTTIGYGSEKQGDASTHGAPLKPDDIRQFKEKNGLNPDEQFVVPKDVASAYHAYAERGQKVHAEWEQLLAEYGKKFPKEHAEIERRIARRLPDGWEKVLPTYSPSDSDVATRKLSESVIKQLSGTLPEFLCGSADLTGSNLTRWPDAVDFQPPQTGLGTYAGRYVRYGVREHAMGAIMNGIHAFGFHIPSGGTFLNFVMYGVGAVRLSAISKFRVIWIATHDSIGLGEDGPTHQPIEAAASLRAMPNLDLWRPADGNETSAAYKVSLESLHNPSVLALSRQNLPQLQGSTMENAVRGGYVLAENPQADITIVSTGSEVGICVDATKLLEERGIKARVVSLPCFSVFDKQSLDYRTKVFPSGKPILSVEAFTTFGWGKYSHVHHGINRYGASGPYKDVYKKFQMTPPDIAKKATEAVEHFKQSGIPLVSPVAVEAAFVTASAP